MSDVAQQLLGAASTHSSFAPLSSSQTIGFCKHLQSQIDAIAGTLDELSERFAHSQEDHAKLNELVKQTVDRVESNEDQQSHFEFEFKATRSELSRSHASNQRLMTKLDEVNSDVITLRENNKAMSVKIDQLAQDNDRNHQHVCRIQESWEKELFHELKHLRDDFAKSTLNIEHVQNELSLVKHTCLEEKAELREAHAAIRELRSQLQQDSTTVGILEERAKEASSHMKSLSDTVNDLKTNHVVHFEDHERTKLNLENLQISSKRLFSHFRHTQTTLDVAVQSLTSLQNQVSVSNGTMNETRKTLDSCCEEVRAVRDHMGQANGKILNLQKQVASNNEITMQVKQDLSETTSILLPNIHAEQSTDSPLSCTGMSPSRPFSRILPSVGITGAGF